MKWTPYHRFEIQSALSPQAAIEALKAHVEERRMFRVGVFPNPANDKRFHGDVSADSFSISRITGYRNSFLPNVTGKVRGTGSRSTIDVEMKLHSLVVVLLIVIMAMLLLIVGAAAFAADAMGLVSLVLLPALAYGGVLWGFWFEAEKQERALREIFNGT
ncbi:hypothetical protein [Terricaulis silvestris]|nr:hypothetical protein [Terricaulis silvestris]